MNDFRETKHKWWHRLFEFKVTNGMYRFVKHWYGADVQYQKIGCSICKRLVRVNYSDEYDDAAVRELLTDSKGEAKT